MALPNLGEKDRDNLGKVFQVAEHLVKNSGVEDISGLGMSSIAVEKEFYRNKMVLHHYPGKNTGYLWSFFGGRRISSTA